MIFFVSWLITFFVGVAFGIAAMSIFVLVSRSDDSADIDELSSAFEEAYQKNMLDPEVIEWWREHRGKYGYSWIYRSYVSGNTADSSVSKT